MLGYKVISLYNKTNNFNIDIFQKTKTEFKVRTQIGFNSYSTDYVWGLYDLAKSCFCYITNGYELVTNNLGFDFAYAVHSGDFTALIEPEKQAEEPPLTRVEEQVEEPPPLTRCEKQAEEPDEKQAEDLLIRSESVILNLLQNPEVELPWKLAD